MVQELDQHIPEYRAEQLERHTRLSKQEALVWAARDAGLSHSSIATDLDISESASQEYYSRAMKKAREAARTHAFLNEREPLPGTDQAEGLPIPEPEELTLDELTDDLRAVDYWLDLGVESVWAGEMDLQKHRKKVEKLVIERLRDEIDSCESYYDEPLLVWDMHGEESAIEPITTTDRGRFEVGGGIELTEQDVLRLFRNGTIEIAYEKITRAWD